MGRDSRRNIAKQLRLPESIFLVAELNHGGDTTEVRNQKSEVRTGYSDFSNQHSDFRCSVPIPKGEKARRSTGKKGRLVGAVLGTHDGRKGWINRLTVAPAYRHRGIAARLVAEVEKRLRRTGIAIISALIEDGNQTSMQAFARLGYEERRDIVYFVKRRRADI
jgi:ribosomal protein S18 acetylase RimI-like enzyme